MISIDTEILKQLVNVARATNEDITGAVDILNCVITHNNWNCKERSIINEYTVKNKTQIKKLKEVSDGFLNAILCISDEFANTEKSIPEMFSSVDAVIGQIISIPTYINNFPQSAGFIAREIVSGNKTLDKVGKTIQQMMDGIKVVKFDLLDLKK